MSADELVITGRLVAAIVVGGMVGFERSFRGRPAGFRTHALVCLASALLMLVTVYEWRWVQPRMPDTIRMDPTRMAQGIMTGIGFLGAGVIFKEGLTVRGLTTAASVWTTAALGILIGIGFYFPAVVTTGLTLFALSAFRWAEARMPVQSYARVDLSFARDAAPQEAALRGRLQGLGFALGHLGWRTGEDGHRVEYRMMVRTTRPGNFDRLVHALLADPMIVSFRVSPTGD
jgi:putative Mg2+ transporter-C (MgtC) family protein